MKHFLTFLLCTTSLLLPSQVQALSIFDIFPNEKPGQAPIIKQEEHPLPQKTKKSRITEEMLLHLERKRIQELQMDFALSGSFCRKLSEANEIYCYEKAREQELLCADQETRGKRIIIDLEHQLLYALKDCQLLAYTHVITGKNSTPSVTGHFKILFTRQNHVMQTEDGGYFVNMALYYTPQGSAVHDASWRIDWNTANRSWGGSHGCINTPHQPMEIIWENFDVGDTVDVYRKLPADVASELQGKSWDKEPVLGVQVMSKN